MRKIPFINCSTVIWPDSSDKSMGIRQKVIYIFA